MCFVVDISSSQYAVDTVSSMLSAATAAIQSSGSSSPRLDAELLLGHVLGVSRAELFMELDRKITGAAAEAFQALVDRRSLRHEPVAYILGYKAFRRLELAVNPSVLIPRPETELLVEWATKFPSGKRIIDLCTGSGAVALALKDERPDLDVIGADINEAALNVARKNAQRLNLDVDFLHSDLLLGADKTPICRAGDVVLANPPYIPENEWLELAPEVLRHEPQLALHGGEDGLKLVRKLVFQAAELGVSALAIEIGYGQSQKVCELFVDAGLFAVRTIPDLAGIERVVCGEVAPGS